MWNLLKKLPYVSQFWISSEKKDIFWKIFWKGCGSRILCVFSRSLRKNIYKKTINSGFGTKRSVFEQKFCCFGRKTFSTIGTTAFFFSRSKLWWKKSMLKLQSFWITLRLRGANFFWVLARTFWHGCQNCFPWVQASSLRKKSFWKSDSSILDFTRKTLNLTLKNSEMLSNPNSTRPKHQFHRLLFLKVIMFIIFGIWSKHFRILANNLCSYKRNGHLRVQINT